MNELSMIDIIERIKNRRQVLDLSFSKFDRNEQVNFTAV